MLIYQRVNPQQTLNPKIPPIPQAFQVHQDSDLRLTSAAER